MRTKFRPLLLLAAMALYAPMLAATRQADTGDNGAITCRVIEAHAAAHPTVVAVVFHQAQKADQPRLASLLLQHSGEEAEVQVTGGARTAGSVFRLKSCFGRGLLLLPADAPPLKDGETFTLQFAQDKARN